MISYFLFLFSVILMVVGGLFSIYMNITDPSWMAAHLEVSRLLLFNSTFLLGIMVGIGIGKD